LDITDFFFRTSTQVKAEVRSSKAVTRVRIQKKKPVTCISNTGHFFCFNNNVSNLYTNSVVEKTNGTAFNPTTTLKLIYISPIDCAFKKKCQVLYIPINPIYFVNYYSKI
jgi:hypothetical protein